jgi:methyltransferase (TIGR00027 family)
MIDEKPSQTAIGTGYLRAAHQVLDGSPRLFEDPLAVTVLGDGAQARIEAERERYTKPEVRLLMSHVVLRARFTEDRLHEAVRRGVSQYVVLGAGLDTFALRQPEWARSLGIFEVDHPSTQQFKQAAIARAGLPIPGNVTYGAIDFTRESLADGLTRIGVDRRQPTFFSWLGVTMYLPGEAIDRALHAMAAFPPGSEVVLTFMPPPDSEKPGAVAARARLSSLVASVGEAFVSLLTPADMETRLRAAGFAQLYFLTPDDARTRYFAAPASLPVPHRTSIAAAIR